MRFHSPFTEAHLASGGKLIFTVVVAAMFVGLLVSGIPNTTPAPVLPETPRLPTDKPAGLRQDTALPTCTSPLAIQGVQGQLVRTKTARIIGLTDVHEIDYDQKWARTCQAKVNLDFGTQPVIYTIRRIADGPQTWELVVTTH